MKLISTAAESGGHVAAGFSRDVLMCFMATGEVQKNKTEVKYWDKAGDSKSSLGNGMTRQEMEGGGRRK